jgi:hypothetical protein
VEKILNSRFRYRCLEYLVQWKGYYAGQNMWVPAHNVFAPNAIATFHQQNPGAPWQINTAFFDTISFRYQTSQRAEASGNWRTHAGSSQT